MIKVLLREKKKYAIKQIFSSVISYFWERKKEIYDQIFSSIISYFWKTKNYYRTIIEIFQSKKKYIYFSFSLNQVINISA